MKTFAERISEINSVAQTNWEKAKGMLEMFNDIYDTQYGWLARRVVRFDNPEASDRYAHAHDAYAESHH